MQKNTTLADVHCAGLAFAGVHDSFWTHAGDVRRLAGLLRETFVELHSQPLLEQLLADFQEQHPNVEFPPIPAKGDLDITSVLDSEYFFS
jgi:DNA-directed RNA polymerase